MDDSESELWDLVNSVFNTTNSIHFIIRKNEGNVGVAESRINGLKTSSGSLIHMIDQDDEVNPSFYAKTIATLKSNDIVLVNGFFKHLKNNKSYKIYYFQPEFTLKNLILDDFLRSPGQVVFRRELLGGITYLAPKKYKGADDRFFWIQIFAVNRNIKTHYFSEPLYVANLHDNNFSNDSLQLYQSCMELWDLMPKELWFDHEKNVNKNKMALAYVLGDNKSLNALIEFVLYKYRVNRIFRFIVKKAYLSW